MKTKDEAALESFVLTFLQDFILAAYTEYLSNSRTVKAVLLHCVPNYPAAQLPACVLDSIQA